MKRKERIDEFLNVAQNLGVKEISNNSVNDVNDDVFVINEKIDMSKHGDSMDDIDIWNNCFNRQTTHSFDERMNEHVINSDNSSTYEVRTFSGYNSMEDQVQCDGTNESNTVENVNQSIEQKSKIEEKTTEENFTCKQCGLQYSQKNMMKEHMMTSHLQNVDRKYPCNQCDKKFSAIKDLQEHTDVQHDGLRVSCNICNKQFTKMSHLREHIKSVHQGVRHPCNQCEKQYTTKSGLKEHTMIKHEGLRFPCSQCAFRTKDRRNIVEHMRLVHNIDVKNQPIKLE